MKSIGIYIPKWFYSSFASHRIFTDELIANIASGGSYTPLVFDVPRLPFSVNGDAKRFCDKHNLLCIVQFDSHYFADDISYTKNVNMLSPHVTFVNSLTTHTIGHNKIATKKVLRENNVPVLDDREIASAKDLCDYLEENKLYVVKPPDNGGGVGVKLIKRSGAQLFEYYDGAWRTIYVTEKINTNQTMEVRLQHPFAGRLSLLFTAILGATVFLIVTVPDSIAAVGGLGAALIVYFLKHEYDAGHAYRSMLIEPYFNDDTEGFSSVRCTVIGSDVVEAVKKTNRTNITSNISHGGKARKIELTEYQKEIAVAATKAIGADFAGVDILVCGGRSVICEVNIGPVGVYGTYTNVNVGGIFANYLIKKCDDLRLVTET